MFQAKSNLSKLVELVLSGAEKEVILAKNGTPVVKIVPIGRLTDSLRVGVAQDYIRRFGLTESPDVDAQ